ncbi:hypothetical protein VTI74DRAFT_7877 [Chaetomium olivicolor]
MFLSGSVHKTATTTAETPIMFRIVKPPESRSPMQDATQDINQALDKKNSTRRYSKKSPETILRLSLDTLRALPVEILENVPPDSLVQVPVELLSRLSARVLTQLPPYKLAALPTEILAQIPAYSLARVGPSVLEALPPQVLLEDRKDDPNVFARLCVMGWLACVA